MSELPKAPTQRVSSVPFPQAYDLPAAPEGASLQVQDAYRQTHFLLRGDLRLFEEGMRLQLRVLKEASHSSFRTHSYAALVGPWSRAFLALADASLLITRGSYGSAVSLLRTACEYVAAQQHLYESEMHQFTDWLSRSLTANERNKAVDIGLGFFAGGTLASDERLGAVYRPASDLSQPNFGATLLFVGPESNNQRLALVFADSAFHLGWAQLTSGWLLALCERQLAVVTTAEDVFGGDADRRAAVDALVRRVEEALSKPDRCRVEEIQEEGMRRYLLHNFRRAPGGAAKKLLL